jgi:predicted transcriptional regulator of viral defense system
MEIHMADKKTFSSLSQTETELIARLSYEKKEIVTAKEIDSFLPANFPYRRQLVFRLKTKNILIPIKNGIYIFVPLESVPTGRRVSEFIIPSVYFPKGNYYIGYSTMFNYYNFTDQQFQKVYVINTRLSKEKKIAGVLFKFINVSQAQMYGIEKKLIKGVDVCMSSKEKTLVDLVYFNKPVGGFFAAGEIVKRFVTEKRCDIKTLIDYATRFPNIKTRKYMGYILEECGISDALLKPLAKSVKETSIASLSESRKGTLNKKWRIIINDTRR